MNTFWVKDSGCLEETELIQLLEKYSSENKYRLAYFSGGFRQLSEAELRSVMGKCETLLEMRIFDAGSELHIQRSTLGKPFFWRIADDAVLAKRVSELDDAFLRKSENHMLEERQYLENPEERRAAEYLPLMPEENAVKVIVYVGYDDNGIAMPVDYRLAGFASAEEEGH